MKTTTTKQTGTGLYAFVIRRTDGLVVTRFVIADTRVEAEVDALDAEHLAAEIRYVGSVARQSSNKNDLAVETTRACLDWQSALGMPRLPGRPMPEFKLFWLAPSHRVDAVSDTVRACNPLAATVR